MLRYFNFEPSFKFRWYYAHDLFGSRIPVTTRGFGLRISCIRSSYLVGQVIVRMQEIRSSNSLVATGICDPNKSRAQHYRKYRKAFMILVGISSSGCGIRSHSLVLKDTSKKS